MEAGASTATAVALCMRAGRRMPARKPAVSPLIPFGTVLYNLMYLYLLSYKVRREEYLILLLEDDRNI